MSAAAPYQSTAPYRSTAAYRSTAESISSGASSRARRAGAPAIELKGISKTFGSVKANRDVSMTVPAGTIHGVIGENGAGKSTLMNILYGFYQADAGEIRVAGEPANIRSSDDALAHGIGMVHQHFMLVDTFTVLENVMLGAEGGALLKGSRQRAREALENLEREFELEVDSDALIKNLPVGLQQRVEILKALYRGADILILDEPTGVLTPQEVTHLFRILTAMRDQGKTVLLITHKLGEIMAITDNVSVMRGGEMVANVRTADTSQEDLAELMVGRRVLLRVDRGKAAPGAVKLSVDNVSWHDSRGVERLKSLSFDVRGGEIVGVAGVSGNGQSELLEALSGMRLPDSGTIEVMGKNIQTQGIKGPRGMRQLGLAHVPEDRHRLGLITAFMAAESGVLGYHDQGDINDRVMLKPARMMERVGREMQEYDVRPPNPRLRTAGFSGGNQQKLILAREMDQDPEVLLVGQPTRGVDIGAIEFIHRRLIEMRDAGKAILLVSVELDEIMNLADRILVMADGRLVGEVNREEANEQLLGLMMAGIDPRREDAPKSVDEAIPGRTAGTGTQTSNLPGAAE